MSDEMSMAETVRYREELRALRPSVAAFALAMEAKLRKHDAKRGVRGWEGDSDDALFARLMEEEHELRRVLEENTGFVPNWTGIRDEAADVANFAMMIADNHGSLEGLKRVADALAATRQQPAVSSEALRERLLSLAADTRRAIQQASDAAAVNVDVDVLCDYADALATVAEQVGRCAWA